MDVARERVDVARERIERTVRELMRVVAEFEANQPALSREGVALLIGATKAFLRGDAVDLPTLLDVKPPPGRRDLAAHVVAARLAGHAVHVVHADPPSKEAPPMSTPWDARFPLTSATEDPPIRRRTRD